MTFPSGSQVIAYASSVVPFGGTCVPETRQCNNGVLSGTGAFSSCSVNAPMSCLFNGRTIAHLESVMAYSQAQVPYGQVCQSESRVCNNGTLTGSAQASACTVATPIACSFNGMPVAHGASTTAYQSASVPFGQQCIPQTRICSNGTLSGSGVHTACVVGPASNCSFGGATVAHNASVTAYPYSSMPYGSACTPQTRTCSNGSLSGSAGYTSCAVAAPASCYFNGQTIGHGGAVVAYASNSVPWGSACAAETRYCSNGALSGSFGHSACQTEVPSELWTWQADWWAQGCYTKTMACDGLQLATCQGSGCPYARWYVYWALPYLPTSAPFTPGSQTTQRPDWVGIYGYP